MSLAFFIKDIDGKIFKNIFIFAFVCSLFLVGINQESFAEEFDLIITGEKNPRIDTDYLFQVTVNGTLGDDRVLQVYLEDEMISTLLGEYKFSTYDRDLIYTFKLDMSKFQWDVEKKYLVFAKLGSVEKRYQIHPVSLDVEDSIVQHSEPTVRIHELFEKPMEDRWLAVIDICAADERLTSPIVRIISDMDDVETALPKIISPNSCSRVEGFDVVAHDPNSVMIEYVTLDTKYGTEVEESGETMIDETPEKEIIPENKDEVSELKKEIEHLKLELKKKDAVLMEQVKVISQLAMSMKNTMTNYFSNFLGIF